ncbi:MAG: hypothetical protein ACREA2_21435 [Blastocatellia bacterium]
MSITTQPTAESVERGDAAIIVNEPESTLEEIVYPESDGKPMAENTVQYRWLTRIKDGLEARFKHDPQVFIAGDPFWYPIKGQSHINQAPDVMVAIGRPKGDLGSYITDREVERAAKEAERAAKEAAWAKLRELGIDPEKL